MMDTEVGTAKCHPRFHMLRRCLQVDNWVVQGVAQRGCCAVRQSVVYTLDILATCLGLHPPFKDGMS